MPDRRRRAAAAAAGDPVLRTSCSRVRVIPDDPWFIRHDDHDLGRRTGRTAPLPRFAGPYRVADAAAPAAWRVSRPRSGRARAVFLVSTSHDRRRTAPTSRPAPPRPSSASNAALPRIAASRPAADLAGRARVGPGAARHSPSTRPGCWPTSPTPTTRRPALVGGLGRGQAGRPAGVDPAGPGPPTSTPSTSPGSAATRRPTSGRPARPRASSG